LWSCSKLTTTNENCAEFPAYNPADLDPFFKALHDTVCVGEMRDAAMFGEWGLSDQYARKNEYHSHDGQNYKEDPLNIGLNWTQVYDPIKYFNVFNYGYCMYYGTSSCNLYQMLGLEARQWSLSNGAHRVSDVYYNGGWHYFDWNEGGWGANTNGVTYGLDWATTHASTWDQVPVHSYYFWTLANMSNIKNYLAHPSYLFLGADHGGGADMSFSLRIGEKIERFFQPINNTYIHPNANPATYQNMQIWGNARMTYHPTLQAGYADYLDGIYEQSNATLVADGVDLANGSVTWAVRIPYPIYNSIITVTQNGGLTTQLSFDLGKTWTIYSGATQAQQRYDYLVKISGTGKITGFNIVTISSLSPGALPKIHAGSNTVRLKLYDNDETLTLLPDWRNSTGFNRFVIDANGFTYQGTDTWRNGGKTNGGGIGAYMTLELTGPTTGQIRSISGNFLAQRTNSTSFSAVASNTFDIKVGNSQGALVTTTTIPAHINTTVATMNACVANGEYGFGHWGHALNFERDSITNPGRSAYIQCYNRGQNASIRENELYMHYYVNHFPADYFNDIIIQHITNRTYVAQDTFNFSFSAEQLAASNGTLSYNINPSSVVPRDPNHSVTIEVPGGVLLTDLQQNPTVGIDKAASVASADLMLEQNNPNPFNPTTTISFALKGAEKRHVQIDVRTIKGELVKTLQYGALVGGSYSVTWDGTNSNGAQVASGIYVYTLSTGKEILSRKMILTR